MLDWLSENSGLIAIIVGSVAGLNIILVAVAKALDGIKDMTSTNIDNSISNVLNKITGVLGKIVEFISANTLPKK
jgi:hypothetical protein